MAHLDNKSNNKANYSKVLPTAHHHHPTTPNHEDNTVNLYNKAPNDKVYHHNKARFYNKAVYNKTHQTKAHNKMKANLYKKAQNYKES